MKWLIDDKVRCDIAFYSGTSCSGHRDLVEIYPSGRQGDVVRPFSSLIFVGWPRLRLTLCTTTDEEGWADHPYRVIRMTEDYSYRNKRGWPTIRVHDLDVLHAPHLLRLPVDDLQPFPEVDDPDEAEGWSYGRGAGQLKGKVTMIKIEKA